MKKTTKEERHDIGWRGAAKCEIESAIYQAKRAISHLENEHDYFAQVHGHSALKMLADALSNIAAAVERRRTNDSGTKP